MIQRSMMIDCGGKKKQSQHRQDFSLVFPTAFVFFFLSSSFSPPCLPECTSQYTSIAPSPCSLANVSRLPASTPRTTAGITGPAQPSCEPAGHILSRMPSLALASLSSQSVSVRLYQYIHVFGPPFLPSTQAIGPLSQGQLHRAIMPTPLNTPQTTTSFCRSSTLTSTVFLPSTDAYTIRAVGQEEFSDVKVPDAPAESQKK